MIGITDLTDKVFCNECGVEIIGEDNDNRKPCTNCGSLRRNIHATVIKYITIRGRKNGDNDKR